MRIAVFATLALASFHAVGAIPEVFLPETVRGALLTGPLDRQPFLFTPAKPTDCERTEAMKMVLYRCKASGGQLRLESAGGMRAASATTPTVNFTGVSVFYKPQKNGGVLREYHFTGTWSENLAGAERSSALKWVLYRWNDQAPEYIGFLDLADWGYSVRAVGAAP